MLETLADQLGGTLAMPDYLGCHWVFYNMLKDAYMRNAP